MFDRKKTDVICGEKQLSGIQSNVIFTSRFFAAIEEEGGSSRNASVSIYVGSKNCLTLLSSTLIGASSQF